MLVLESEKNTKMVFYDDEDVDEINDTIYNPYVEVIRHDKENQVLTYRISPVPLN